jgi:small subunit ribosomal protein S20
MANHQSSKKRIKQDAGKKVQNKYYAKTMRNALKGVRNTEEKEAAAEKIPTLVSLIDKLAKKNVIHKNKAANLKSKLALQLNKM